MTLVYIFGRGGRGTAHRPTPDSPQQWREANADLKPFDYASKAFGVAAGISMCSDEEQTDHVNMN